MPGVYTLHRIILTLSLYRHSDYLMHDTVEKTLDTYGEGIILALETKSVA
jgi:hypothetical protein